MDLKIGSTLVTERDIEQTIVETGENVLIPKGSKIVIGFDKLAHFIGKGLRQTVSKDRIVDGVDGWGIIEVIYECLKDMLSFETVLKNSDISEEQFKQVIYIALREIGLFEEEEDEGRNTETPDGE